MAQRFFHKAEPGIKLVLADGTPWSNWTIIDHENGVLAPQSPYLLENLVRCVQQGHSGVSEISEAQYNEWLKKKQTVLPRRWRDEWAPKQVLPSTDGQSTSQSTGQNPSAPPVAEATKAMRPEPFRE